MLRKIPQNLRLVVGSIAVLAIALTTLAWQSYSHIRDLEVAVTHLNQEFASSTSLLAESIANTDKKTLNLSDSLSQEKQKVNQISEQVGGFQADVGKISGTVNTLEKLAKTDPELLQKYSKIFFLNEHYQPAQLMEIDKKYLYNEKQVQKIHTLVWPHLKALLDSAGSASVTLYLKSAFRSFDEQANIKSEYSVTYGAGTANQFSADQGYSEHQLGTTVDLITTGLGGKLEGFDKTTSYQWLLKEAYKHGFILSYPANNSYYVFEPWHWRFVGVELATSLHNRNKHFYNLDQREIDGYLVNIFD